MAVLAAVVAAPSLRAQWVSYTNQTATRLVASANLGTADTQEKDYAWGDLDHDGDIDLVVARKQPFTSTGHYPNVLFMNEGGVLTDRSATLTTSTVPGSSAFLDATNDRDVVIVDVNGDGWEDVVFATTLTDTQPQYIRVPRVYINRGDNGSGVWLGLLYDDPLRIDDTPWGGFQRFCSVAAGDVDGDGDMDLYFGDYQQGGTRPVDLNDRLLINDGTGYFTDESAARMTVEMLESSFGMKVAMVDMNLDGKVDILKDDALNAPQAVSISYNDTATAGVFGTYQIATNGAPYHFNVNDLNNDNQPDIIVSDDGQDVYILHQGVSGGLATFGPRTSFSYSGGGSDDGFGGNNLIVDLDNDGWNDAIVADADVDIPGCSRRCHIFRNLANGPNVTLQEQIVSGQVVGGITPADLVGTFDVAVFDINGDGYKDLVVGRCTGTQVYVNNPPTGMTFAYQGGLPAMIPPGNVALLTVDANGIGGVTPGTGSGVLHYAVNGGAFQTSAMADNGSGTFIGQLPALGCADQVSFYVSVQGSNSVTYTDPPTAPTGFYTAVYGSGTSILYYNDFEADANGWTVVNDPSLSTGAWQRAVPVGTINGGSIAAPFDDAQAGAAAYAFVTQNGAPGGAAGVADVDGGPTDLISPPLDFGGTDGFISYQRWFYSSGTDDFFIVSVSPDGVAWTDVEVIGAASNNQWLANSFRVGDYITPSATTRVRFRANDTGTGHIVEAGVDVFKAEAFSCEICQAVYPLLAVGPASFSMCGGDLSPGTSTTISIVDMPAFTNGLLVYDLFPNPTPWNGGELISPAPIVLGPIFADAGGDFVVPVPIGGLLPPGWALYAQALYIDGAQPFGVGVTNALQVVWH
ncbi:MAG: VCBS repeat-containing protein [Planctomycetes bacterium]|nr:VCBS repeat-containing protein [Planctomycetota bacterium]